MNTPRRSDAICVTPAPKVGLQPDNDRLKPVLRRLRKKE